ncbi:hypothetical protein HELRODRAFT_191018 [Helobdella robusta]|uniref:Uncharacterized protein n=1 Tax=Helobdella robusta TaxID=6412 RepID=T1FSI1_HELRO|nr:hypothetical protein HELRODRAFT_191018 [Helobdella robusta]ESO07702.1 hypothetical protein HELRODRAFT_191018 [Helobdella robusta]
MTYEGTLLNTFVNNNKNNFPLKVVVTTLQEATTVLNNHSITNDTQLVLHGWTKHIKVLAITAGNPSNTPTNDPMTTFNYYAIPLTYQAYFKVKSKFYRGLSNLVSSGWWGWTKAVSTDLSGSPNLRVGDVVRVAENTEDKMKRDYDGGGSITMLKKNNNATVARIHIARSCSAVFKELMEEKGDDLEQSGYDNLNLNDEYTMKQLSKYLNFCDLEVQISKASPDINRPITSTPSFPSSSLSSDNLPFDQNILLLNPIQEQSVLTSIEHPDAPAFRIPLRTLIYVKLKQTLDKTSSPLQQKSSSSSSSSSLPSQSKKPVLSKFDRCVEVLIKDVFISLLPPQRAFERFAHWYFISNSNDTLIQLLQDQHKRLSNELQQQQLLLIKTQQQLQQQLQQTKLLQPQLEIPQEVADNKPTSSSSSRIETEDDDSIGTATGLQSKEGEPHFEIPGDGNLYKLNSQQFFEVLRYIKLNQSTLEKCSRQKLNGKKFASLSHDDMLHMGLLHPVIMHFKMSTFKCK